MKVTIDRSRWRSGVEGQFQVGIGETLLLNKQGFMCCLGFATLATGKVSESDIFKTVFPCDLTTELSPYNKRSEYSDRYVDTDLSDNAAAINDGNLPVEEKEKELIKLFEIHGIDLEFIGEYTYPKIVAAAIMKYASSIYSLPAPNRHHDIFAYMKENNVSHVDAIQGFIDDSGNFKTRSEARAMVIRSGQCPNPRHSKYLFSEDLW